MIITAEDCHSAKKQTLMLYMYWSWQLSSDTGMWKSTVECLFIHFKSKLIGLMRINFLLLTFNQQTLKNIMRKTFWKAANKMNGKPIGSNSEEL